MSREVMQQALEALDSDNPDIQLRAAIALRRALETEHKPKPQSYLDEQEVREITAVAIEVGIVPWVKHEVINGYFIPTDEGMDGDQASLIQFGQLLIKQEREACAQLLDKQADLAGDPMDREWAQEMAAAIRARGKE